MEKSNISKYITLLYKPKINKFNLIVEAMSELSFEELQSFKRKTPKLFQSLLKVSSLKRKRFVDIFTGVKMPWNKNTDIYGVITFIILNNAKEINDYIQLKEKLDLATSIQRYDESYSLLSQIEKNVSVSMVGTYYLLKLTRLDKGITVSTQLYNKIYKENKALSYISNIAFKSAPIDFPFEAEIERKYQNLQSEEEICDFITAFAFPFKRIKGAKWMRLLPNTSLIDLYEGFLFQLSCLTPEELMQDHLKYLIDELAAIIRDKRIQRLYTLVNNGVSLSFFENQQEEKELIEKYYSQDYEYVFTKSLDYLKKNPLAASIVEIFYKSCIKLKQPPEDLYPEDSLVGRLHNLYWMSLMNEDISEVCRVQLRSMCIAWYQIPAMRQIYQIFRDIECIREESIYKNYWRYSQVPEIRDAIFFNDIKNTISYLVSAGYSREYSAQIEILEGKRKDYFNQTYRLLYGFSDAEIPVYCEEIESKDYTPIIIESIISQLFDRLMGLKQYADAVSLYVKSRLKNPYITINVDKRMILREMTDDEDAKITNQLNLAIFYTMIGAETYKRYLAYKHYLKTNKSRRASEIDNINTSDVAYFIGKVVDRNVLALHVREFETEEDITNERIELCKKIYKATNEKSYSDEITSLIKEQEVKALAQQVNDSKIHVDVQSLINRGLSSEKLLFDTYSKIDDDLEMYEQKNIEGIVDYIMEQYYEGKTVVVKYDFPSVKYKRVLFREMFLSIRDKFLFDPVYGLDKYLSARVRHGTLITQLRNHFLTHSLVTNKKEGGGYQRTNPWTQRRYAIVTEDKKEAINERMLQFTIWLDEQLKNIKDEKIQIKTERNDGYVNGLFDYSEDLMADKIDELEKGNVYDSFDAFVHSAIDLLWKWTNLVLENIRKYFQQYEEIVVGEMTKLQSDVVNLIGEDTTLTTNFKDAITACRTEFQTDISVVTSWFKPEQSNVRFFTIQQAVDTSLSVINKINQNALCFSSVVVNDTYKYNGEYFNAIHDIFHDMMNNILGYEAKRPNLRGKGRILISNTNDRLYIEVSNPLEDADIQDVKQVIGNQKNMPALVVKGKTRGENNSGCIKIYSTVMYSLGNDNKYENIVEDKRFVAHIEIDTKNLRYNENTVG